MLCEKTREDAALAKQTSVPRLCGNTPLPSDQIFDFEMRLIAFCLSIGPLRLTMRFMPDLHSRSRHRRGCILDPETPRRVWTPGRVRVAKDRLDGSGSVA